MLILQCRIYDIIFRFHIYIYMHDLIHVFYWIIYIYRHRCQMSLCFWCEPLRQRGAYFIIALITVLICISAYRLGLGKSLHSLSGIIRHCRLLMSLPISRHVIDRTVDGSETWRRHTETTKCWAATFSSVPTYECVLTNWLPDAAKHKYIQ